MHLEKWYADWVFEDKVQIRYLARMQLGPIAIGYKGQLGTERESAVCLTTHGLSMPKLVAGRVCWPHDRIDDPQAWEGAVARNVTLWRDGDQSVCWDPLVLNGAVAPSKHGRMVRGYVERLTLDVAPWRLGLRTLRWGRFCGMRHSLVWIEWEGQTPKRLALLDGRDDPLHHLGNDGVRTERARIDFDSRREIVSERLDLGALNALNGMRSLAPSRFLAGVETKWLAKACLRIDGDEPDQGHAIFEVVVWP